MITNPRPLLFALALFAAPVVASSQEEPSPSAPSERTYAVRAAKSIFAVIIRNDPSAMLSRLGHDHVIQATKASGEVVWPSSEGGACSASFKVPVKSLVVDPPGARDREGLDDNTISDADKDKLSSNMWGGSQLDADNHPYVTLDVPRCDGGEGEVTVKGKLTIRGVTRTLDIPLEVTVDGDVLRAKSRFKTTHAAHDFKPFRGSPFGPKNAEDLTFSIDMVATAK